MKTVPCQAKDKSTCKFHGAELRMEQALKVGNMPAYFAAQEELAAATESAEYVSEVASFFSVRNKRQERDGEISARYSQARRELASNSLATAPQRRAGERKLKEQEAYARARSAGLELIDLLPTDGSITPSDFVARLAQESDLTVAQNVFYNLEREGKLRYSLSKGVVTAA